MIEAIRQRDAEILDEIKKMQDFYAEKSKLAWNTLQALKEILKLSSERNRERDNLEASKGVDSPALVTPNDDAEANKRSRESGCVTPPNSEDECEHCCYSITCNEKADICFGCASLMCKEIAEKAIAEKCKKWEEEIEKFIRKGWWSLIPDENGYWQNHRVSFSKEDVKELKQKLGLE